MSLRIATWNVNSLRQRVDHIARLIETKAPDLLLLQETKLEDAIFPGEFFAERGYRHQIFAGQKSYNGVAILSRLPFEDQHSRIWCERDDKRHCSVRLSQGLEVHNFYVPSGGDKPDPEANDKFAHKLQFLEEMAAWAKSDARDRPMLIAGDFNVAPLEFDVWNHKRLLRSVGHSPIESEKIAALLKAGGFIDIGRHFVPQPQPLYTWWGYRFAQAYAKDYGWRLDHAWATEPLIRRIETHEVYRETRTWEKPSDHVPVIIDLD